MPRAASSGSSRERWAEPETRGHPGGGDGVSADERSPTGRPAAVGCDVGSERRSGRRLARTRSSAACVGHLGEALMRSLQAADRKAIGLDLKPSRFTTTVGSIVDRAVVHRCMRGVRAVLHAATLHKPHIATHRRWDFIDTNVTGTLNVPEEAVDAGCGGPSSTRARPARSARHWCRRLERRPRGSLKVSDPFPRTSTA